MLTDDEALAAVSNAVAARLIAESSAARMKRWLSESPFAPYRPLLVRDIAERNWKTLDEAFYAVLEFGTGGRRGKMYPVGTNVLNARTIAESARGLAEHIAEKKGPDSSHSCVIARDTRHNSREFAEICARVLAAAHFRVYLFPEPRSTPLLSFAVRALGCDAGIMITASHNPPSDNGFKCYASTGGQVVPPDDTSIIECVQAVSDREIAEADYDDAIRSGAIQLVGDDFDRAYIAAVISQSVSKARGLKVVYTPMHGVGETSVAAALAADGFEHVNILASQRTPDGNFPNVPGHVSNPEIPKTLDASIAEAKRTGADLVLASDPDADRIGVAVPVTGDPAGEWTTLDGNQIGVLLAGFVIDETKARGELRPDHYLVSTLVTSQMARALAAQENVRVEDDLLVGFKWIGQRIDQVGPEGFLFGFEESHGYVKGTHVRDKDAASGGFLFAELAATVKARGQTVLEYLDSLYLRVGHYAERLINKTMEGREGVALIKKLMAAFREHPPGSIGGLAVTEIYDYRKHEVRAADGAIRPLPQPSGDLLIFHLDSPGIRFAARPSGTEPKIKFYLFARTDTGGARDRSALAAVKRASALRLDRMTADIEQYIQTALKA
jgi:phosphoglucomutase/phosphomannomutase